MSSALRSKANYGAHQKPRVADTKMAVAAYDHMGWLLCDGRELDIPTFYKLFRQIGTQFGGDGVMNFRLPDMRGAVAGSAGQNEWAPTIETRDWAIGDASGEEFHTLTIAEIPAHNHDMSGGQLDVSNGVVPTAQGNTTWSLTGLTMDVSGDHTHIATDAGHDHAYTSITDNNGGGAIDDAGGSGNGSTTAPGYAKVTLSTNGDHKHNLNDPTHNHKIASNGGGQRHFNMQPTVFLGNTFIYSGFIRFPTHLITEGVVTTTPLGAYPKDPYTTVPY